MTDEPPKKALGKQRAKRGTGARVPPPTEMRTGGKWRRRGRKADKPAQPPEPLQPTVQLKIGKRNLVPRCQYWDMRHADPYDRESPLVFFQCGQPARAPYIICGFHGAGFKTREKAGDRQPAVDPFRKMWHGSVLDERLQTEFLAHNPTVKSIYEELLESPRLLDFIPVVAMARACYEHFVHMANLDKTETPDGSDPPILRAVDAARKLVGIVKDLAEYERRLGPVTNAEVERYVHASAIVLAEFLEPAQLEKARRRFIELVTRDDSAPMGRLRLPTGI